MEPLQFFEAVLPSTGPYFLVAMSDGGSRHIMFPSKESMAKAALRFDSQGAAVYHATASYKEAFVMRPDPDNPGQQKKHWRVAENMGKLKAFYCDIDCGEEKADAGKGYATKREAAQAILGFCSTVGLRAPMLVSSGNGIHAYWPLSRDIGPNAWKAVASSLKTKLAEHKVLADPSRTADPASILRPVGTHNRKGEVKEVKCLHNGGGEMTPEEFAAAVGKAEISEAAFDHLPAHLRKAEVTNGLVAHAKTYPPSDADAIAKHCAQLNAVRETRGCVEYPVWFAALGVLKHTTGGLETAQEWSAGDPTYSEYATAQKFHSWSAGPATCKMFYEHNSSGCDGCPQRNNDGSFKITSPIQLGFTIPEQETEATLVNEVVVPPKPYGFSWNGDELVRSIEDKEGVTEHIPISKHHFYVVDWTENNEADCSATVRLHHDHGEIREFEMPTAAFSSPADTAKFLSSKGIVMADHPKAGFHVTAYMKNGLAAAQHAAKAQVLVENFGWTDKRDGFVLGDTLYKCSGESQSIRLAGMASTMADSFEIAEGGTVKGYAQAVNTVYARAGMEAMQYAFCAGYGSMLTPLAGAGFHGCTFAMTGSRSGKGKTTTAWMMLEGIGDHKKLQRGKRDTLKSQPATMGVAGNLPILFDEFTNVEPDELSDWAYNVTEGKERQRLRASKDGVTLATTAQWAMSPYMTANANLYSKLAILRSDAEAEAVRIVQLSTDAYGIPEIQPSSIVDDALSQAVANRGHAGIAFVKHITTNKADVEADVAHYVQWAAGYIPEQQYRFWRWHTACTLAAAKQLIKLGIIEFDMGDLEFFAKRLLVDLVLEVSQKNVASPDDQLAIMINSLLPNILSTNSYVTNAREAREQCPRTYHELVGRYVIGDTRTNEGYHGVLMLSRSAVLGWCVKNRVDIKQILAAAKKAGALWKDNHRSTLTRGTTLPGAQIWCIWLDTKKLDVEMPTISSQEEQDMIAAANA